MRKFLKVFAASLLSSALLFTIINIVAIELAKPRSLEGESEFLTEKTFGTVEMVPVKDLQSGGLSIFGWAMPAAGYVNFFEAEPRIYVLEGRDELLQQNSSFYRHEYTHILQKEMIANASGGYPSAMNPWQSLKYYYNTFRLNEALKKVMPQTVEGVHPFTSGLEAAADCFAQPKSSMKEMPQFYIGTYLKAGYCSSQQRLQAISLINTDVWFDGIIDDEKLLKLKKENIVTSINKLRLIEKSIHDTNAIDELTMTELHLKYY